MKERDYDSTVARMAGNIAAGFVTRDAWALPSAYDELAQVSVRIARLIIAETKRTEAGKVQEGGPA